MDSGSKGIRAIASSKERSTRSKLRNSENVDPNLTNPGLKSNSPTSMKAEKSAKKFASMKPKSNKMALVSSSPKKRKIQQRKFVMVKKKLNGDEVSSSAADAVVCRKCNKGIGKSKCLCVAYEKLRASQEEFFKNRGETEEDVFDKIDALTEKEGLKTEIDKEFVKKIDENNVSSETNLENEDEVVVNHDMVLKRSRDRLLEGVRGIVSIPGSPKVMHLVKEFEKHLTIGDPQEKEAEEVKDVKELPRCQQPPKVPECHVSLSSFCPSDLILTSESLGLDANRSYSLDSSKRSFNIPNLTSAGGQRLRQSSTESSRNCARRYRKEKQMKATSQKPFMLRTEERGKHKMEEFMKKLQKTLEEEEKKRIPIAQGLPWTTDEPEHLVKPPVKESTKPIDLLLHSDVRAMERSEFDHQVAMKMDQIEQYRRERERQQQLEEEEEIRRLRKELIPRAQPMPYFDRPFIPRRSVKHPTIPKEPKFHIPAHKKIKCCFSLDGLYTQQQH